MKILLSSNLVAQYPNMSKTARNWISAIDKLAWVKDYFDFLNSKLVLLPEGRQEDLFNRIVSPDDDAFWGTNGELIYCGFWDYLKWPFEKDPSLNGKNPDFKVCFDKEMEKVFLSDVTLVTHNYPHIDKEIDFNQETGSLIIKEGGKEVEKLSPVKDPIEQAQRFLMKIAEKFEKYENLITQIKTPFIVCFIIIGFDDNFFLDDFQIQKALFGDLTYGWTSKKLWYQPSMKTTKHGNEVVQGIFTTDEFKSLSAVIICRLEFVNNKAEFKFSVCVNPLGEWGSRRINPFSLFLTISGIPPTLLAIIGRPHAIASITTRGVPSV